MSLSYKTDSKIFVPRKKMNEINEQFCKFLNKKQLNKT